MNRETETAGGVLALPIGFELKPFLPKQPKLFLPVSHNGNGDVKSGWAVSFATAFNGCNVRIEEMGSSHADRACNNMANLFLRTDCDIMLIIDCDEEFSAKDVQRILSHFERGHRAVWGIYPKKQDDGAPCLNTWPEVQPPDEYGLVEVRRSGRGFLAVHRDVFERLKEDNGGPAQRFHNHERVEWSFFRSGIVSGAQYSPMLGDKDADGYPIREWITEDWMFCEDLRNHLGIKTLVDTGIILSHIGTKTYRLPGSQIIRVDNKIESWKDIHGWFDYEDLYRELVEAIPDGGLFVEVGCWLGKSIAAFDAFAKEKGKIIRKSIVDLFSGNADSQEQQNILDAHGNDVKALFEANMQALGIDVEVHAGDSALNAVMFDDQELSAVFIDACHKYQFVKDDIEAWYPKVKSGGIICGHDFPELGVARAVIEYFKGDVELRGRCWYHRKL